MQLSILDALEADFQDNKEIIDVFDDEKIVSFADPDIKDYTIREIGTPVKLLIAEQNEEREVRKLLKKQGILSKYLAKK